MSSALSAARASREGAAQGTPLGCPQPQPPGDQGWCRVAPGAGRGRRTLTPSVPCCSELPVLRARSHLSAQGPKRTVKCSVSNTDGQGENVFICCFASCGPVNSEQDTQWLLPGLVQCGRYVCFIPKKGRSDVYFPARGLENVKTRKEES